MNNEELNFQDIFEILRRQMRLILVSVAVALMLAFLFLSQATPRYETGALVLIDESPTDLLADAPQRGYSSGAMATSRVESVVSIMKSDAVLLRAIEAGELLTRPEFAPRLGLMDKAKQMLGMEARELPSGEELLANILGELRNSMTVRRQGLTFLISVVGRSESPEGAAHLANTVAEAYISSELATKIEGTLAHRDLLSAQLTSAQQRLAESDGAIARYIDSNIARLEEESQDPRIAELRRLLEGSKQSSLEISDLRDRARGALETSDWAALSSSLQDQAVAQLAAERRAIEQRLNAASGDSQVSVNLRAQLSRLDEQLADASEAAISGLETRLADLAGQSDQARNDLRSALLASELSPDTLSELYGLQQDASIAQRQYENLINRIRDLEISASVKTADTRIVSPAMPPRVASYPKEKLVLAMTLFVGLTMGVALAFAKELYFGGVSSVSQLGNLLPLRAIGVAPRVKLRAGMISPADMVVDQPLSIYAEAYRRVRAVIDKRPLRQRGRARVILVTSALPNEGKSVCSLSLARTYAVAGKRTLLIDGDLRKPSQHKQIGVSPKTGLLDYLVRVGDDETPEIYQIDPKCNLGVVLGNKRADVPTDQLVLSDAFLSLLQTARESFDVIILDSPPMLPVVDARYLVDLADHVLLCVRSEQTSQGAVRAVWAQLSDCSAIAEDPGMANALLTVDDRGGTAREGYSYGYGGGA